MVLTASCYCFIDRFYRVDLSYYLHLRQGGRSAFMLYYPPKNDQFVAPDDSSVPPLLVKSHGGPTSRARTTYNAGWQYFTSRGFAVADVDYGGSTGFGKEYRNRLKGQWGVVDVDDCCNAALHLADIGLADRKRLVISGGSAGGFTTLACLAFRPNVFSAGASYYGVADLKLLAAETHKFESRYLDSLVGPYPEAISIYEARSPVLSANHVRCPLVQFQGLEDRVVPPSQARAMFKALQSNGIPTALVEFPGEQHGFRGTAAIRRALDGELWFYGRVLGFLPQLGSADFEPFEIVE
jgi:dipeptidyl aminopeptidase/acylaminoacyl peptidase